MGYTRVDKKNARKMFYSGVPIVLVPCKCDDKTLDTDGATPISLLCESDIDPLSMMTIFDVKVNSFQHFMCSNEKGRYVHYYVKDSDYANYKMCDMMC